MLVGSLNQYEIDLRSTKGWLGIASRGDQLVWESGSHFK